MATTLGQNTVNKIRTYIDEGVPLEDLSLSRDQIERIRVAEQVYERIQQDPMLDVNRCLMRTFGRTRQQVPLDKQVIEMLMDSLDEPSRKLLTYRARKVAERLVRIGEQTGDAKWVDKGLTQLIRLDRLNEEDVPQEDVRNTASLPPIMVDISMIDPNRTAVSDERFRALLEKYGGKEDEFEKLLRVRDARQKGDVSALMDLYGDVDDVEPLPEEKQEPVFMGGFTVIDPSTSPAHVPADSPSGFHEDPLAAALEPRQ